MEDVAVVADVSVVVVGVAFVEDVVRSTAALGPLNSSEQALLVEDSHAMCAY